jgi:hypothetical protein
METVIQHAQMRVVAGDAMLVSPGFEGLERQRAFVVSSVSHLIRLTRGRQVLEHTRREVLKPVSLDRLCLGCYGPLGEVQTPEMLQPDV